MNNPGSAEDPNWEVWDKYTGARGEEFARYGALRIEKRYGCLINHAGPDIRVVLVPYEPDPDPPTEPEPDDDSPPNDLAQWRLADAMFQRCAIEVRLL